MTIMFPYCNGFKCGAEYCQNNPLAKEKNIDISIDDIIYRYINNSITESIVMQGLEPFDSWEDLLELVSRFRQVSNDDVVIYTGYYEYEIKDKINKLMQYKNIIIKFGRFIPEQNQHYDEILGVHLASNNQYAERIS